MSSTVTAEPGGQALDDDDQRLAVRLAGGEVAQHRRHSYRPLPRPAPRSECLQLTECFLPGVPAEHPRSPETLGSGAAGELGEGRGAHRGRVGRDAGPQLLLQDGLVDEHARAVDASSNPGLRRPAAAPSAAGGRRGRRRPGPGAAAPGRTAAPLVPSPMRRGVDDDVGAGDVGGRADPRRRGQRGGLGGPLDGVRLTMAMSAAPARPTASTTLRAAAPAPTTGDGATADARRPMRRARRRTRRRRCCGRPAARPTRPTVFTDRNAAAAGASDVDGRGDVLLVRRRHRQPAEPQGAHRRQRLRPPIRAPPRTPRTPSPARRARNAALCSAGDSECCTGEPMTAATRIGCRSVEQAGSGRRVHVGLVLLGRHGEGVAAVLVGQHVVQVLARRRPRAARRTTGRRRSGSAPG